MQPFEAVTPYLLGLFGTLGIAAYLGTGLYLWEVIVAIDLSDLWADTWYTALARGLLIIFWLPVVLLAGFLLLLRRIFQGE